MRQLLTKQKCDYTKLPNKYDKHGSTEAKAWTYHIMFDARMVTNYRIIGSLGEILPSDPGIIQAAKAKVSGI